MLKTSAAGRALIEQFEGRRLQSYRDSAGIWTIGIGHTGPDVLPNLTISNDYCDFLFSADLETAERAIAESVKVPLKQHQFDACVSLAFNIGNRAFKNSTLVKHLNGGRYSQAADQFPRWCHSGGQVIKGLIRRRAAERDLFLGDRGVTVS